MSQALERLVISVDSAETYISICGNFHEPSAYVVFDERTPFPLLTMICIYTKLNANFSVYINQIIINYISVFLEVRV